MKRAFFGLASLLFLFASSGLTPAADRRFPDFELKLLDGSTLRSKDLAGKVTVIDFWATWCQPCRASMPHLNALQDHFGQRGLVVLGVSVDDGGPLRVRRFAEHMGVHIRLLMADEHVLDEYGPIRSIPTTFFIDQRGQVVRRVVGYIDPETMESFALELFDH